MKTLNVLRKEIANVIGIRYAPNLVSYKIISETQEQGYTRKLIEYGEDNITAYLLIPDKKGLKPAVLIHHQHNGERHLGKSEVCGLAGNPLQSFGVALVKKGFAVLAPDSICFEDRRQNAKGIEPLPNDGDFLQHYNKLCYGILTGETLAKKVIEDAMEGISLLEQFDFVDKRKIGTMGHSYGGNTTLFLAALDTRIKFACASGSAVTYKNRIENNTGIEMASVIPGFYPKYDITVIVKCIAPQKLLIVSASEDKYSKDADNIYQKCKEYFDNNLVHKRYQGGHALTKERFDYIIDWFSELN